MPSRVLLASFVRRHQHPQKGLELARHLFSVQKEQPTQDLLQRDCMPSILVQSNRRPACQDFMRLRYKQHNVSLFHPKSSLSIFVIDQTDVNRMFLCLFRTPKATNVLLEHLAVSSIFPLILWAPFLSYSDHGCFTLNFLVILLQILKAYLKPRSAAQAHIDQQSTKMATA